MVIVPRCQLIVIVLLFGWASVVMTLTTKCPLSNTVDLGSATKHSNGSYTYKGLLIPPEWIEEYEEVIQNGEQVQVAKHMRGCLCKAKSCVNLCCPHSKAKLDIENAECLPELEEYTYTPKANITMINTSGRFIQKTNLNDFVPLYGFPCKNSFAHHPEETNLDIWYLKEDGSIHFDAEQEDLQLGSYCLHPDVHLISKEYVYKLYRCPIISKLSTIEIAITYIMTISAVCMVTTIIMFLFVGKRTEHQNLFICYLITLCVSYVILVFNNSAVVSNGACYIIGYIGYFVVMASFFLLTVLSVSMWNKFRSSNFYAIHTKSKMRLVICFLISFGGAAILTAGTIFAEFSSLDEKWKPRVGHYTCWISTEDGNSAYIYFYGPMIVLIVINFIMFILTSLRIWLLKSDVNRVNISMNFHSVQKKYSFVKEFSLYLRIFFTMGISWILEIISYNYKENTYLSISSDLINAAQGIIMFLLFGNFQLLYKRYHKNKLVTENYCTQSSDVQKTSVIAVGSMKKLMHDDKMYSH